MLSPVRPKLFAVFESDRLEKKKLSPGRRSALLFLQRTAWSISIQALKRVARCCRLPDGDRVVDGRCKARGRFRKRASIGGANCRSPSAIPARTIRGAQSEDQRLSWQRR